MADYKSHVQGVSQKRRQQSVPRNLVARVWQRFELLKQPFPRQALKLEGSEGLYRLRVGDYRIIYGVDVEGREVLIHHVRHRREVYRSL